MRMSVVICGCLAFVSVLTYEGYSFVSVGPLSAAFSDDSLAVNTPQVAELEWPVQQPTADAESMLKRFVDECVEISMGTLKVPRAEADSVLGPELVIDRSYRICRFETTQELFQLVMGVNPSRWKGPRNSVEQISYADAVQFCEKLTMLLRARNLIGKQQSVRLPSDAEWEFACRAGAKSKYCFGNSAKSDSGVRTIDQYAWHNGNAAGNDPSVGQLKGNRWKLADVHGYLWEFTQTASVEAVTGESDVRIWGGSWRASPSECGCSSIRQVSADFKAPDLGFRCVIQ